MTRGLVCMVLANGAGILAVRALLRRVASADPAWNLVAALLLHLLLLSVTVLALGLAGLLRAEVLGGLGLAVLAVLLARGEWRAPSPAWRPPLGRKAGAVVAALALVLALQVWIYSPSAIDALSYHLPKVAVWVQTGSIGVLPGADVRESFPAGLELLEAWWTVFLRHDVLIELAGLEFFALGFAGVLLLASRLGVAEAARPWCGVLYLLIPGLHQHATSAMNDGAVAALVVAVAGLVVARSPVWLLAAAVLLGAGVKPTFLVTLPGFAWLAWTLRREPALVASGATIGRVLAAVAALPGLFWYARNAAWHGNPLYPAGDGRYWAAPSLGEILREGGARLESLIGPAPTDAVEPISLLLVQSAGWGILAFAVGIPALLATVREDRAFRRCLGAFLAGLLGVAFAVHPRFHFLRFVLFFPAILVIAAVHRAHREPLLRKALVAGGALLFFMTLLPHEVGTRGFAERWKRPWFERGRDERLGELPPEAAVAAIRGLNSESYSLTAPDGRRRIHYVGDLSNPRVLEAELDRLGVRWIDSRGWPEHPGTRDALQALLKTGRWRKAARDLAERVRPP